MIPCAAVVIINFQKVTMLTFSLEERNSKSSTNIGSCATRAFQHNLKYSLTTEHVFDECADALEHYFFIPDTDPTAVIQMLARRSIGASELGPGGAELRLGALQSRVSPLCIWRPPSRLRAGSDRFAVRTASDRRSNRPRYLSDNVITSLE